MAIPILSSNTLDFIVRPSLTSSYPYYVFPMLVIKTTRDNRVTSGYKICKQLCIYSNFHIEKSFKIKQLLSIEEQSVGMWLVIHTLYKAMWLYSIFILYQCTSPARLGPSTSKKYRSTFWIPKGKSFITLSKYDQHYACRREMFFILSFLILQMPSYLNVPVTKICQFCIKWSS